LELVDADEIDKLELEAGALGGEGLEYTESIPEALLHAAGASGEKKKKKHRRRDDAAAGGADAADGTERRAKKKKKDKKSRRAVESLAASLEANLESTFGQSLLRQTAPATSTSTSTTSTSTSTTATTSTMTATLPPSATAPPQSVVPASYATEDLTPSHSTIAQHDETSSAGAFSAAEPADAMEVVAGQLSDPSASKTDSRKQRFQELQARKNQLEVAIDQTNANLRSVQLALSTTMRANPVLRVRAATVQLASHHSLAIDSSLRATAKEDGLCSAGDAAATSLGDRSRGHEH